MILCRREGVADASLLEVGQDVAVECSDEVFLARVTFANGATGRCEFISNGGPRDRSHPAVAAHLPPQAETSEASESWRDRQPLL
jgi:hypothetical protein